MSSISEMLRTIYITIFGKMFILRKQVVIIKVCYIIAKYFADYFWILENCTDVFDTNWVLARFILRIVTFILN